MSSAVKAVVSVVVAVAIPFVAPAIASSIGLSTAIGTAVGSATAGSVLGGALVGAGIGAVNASLTGGNVGRGALMGGIGGGIGGYTSAPSSAPTPPPTPTPTGGAPVYDVSATGQLVPAPGYGSPPLTGAAPPVAPPSAPLMAPVASPGVMAPTTTPFFPGEGVLSGVPEFDLAAARAGLDFGPQTAAQLSTGFEQQMATAGISPTAAAPTAAAPTAAAPTAATSPAGAMGPQTAAQLSTGFQQQMTAAGVASKPATFMDALSRVPGEIAAKFTDPKALADMTLRAAGMLAGSAVAGSGLSADEQQLLDAQVQELRDLQQTNATLFAQRLEQAQALVGESKYFDPEYFGLQRARRAQLAGAKAKRAGLRGLTGAAREAESRRFDLATSRDVGTAFDQGYLTGVGGRLQTMQAGLNMMPTSYPTSSSAYSNLRSAYSDAEARRQREVGGVQRLFGSLLETPQASSRG